MYTRKNSELDKNSGRNKLDEDVPNWFNNVNNFVQQLRMKIQSKFEIIKCLCTFLDCQLLLYFFNGKFVQNKSEMEVDETGWIFFLTFYNKVHTC